MTNVPAQYHLAKHFITVVSLFSIAGGSFVLLAANERNAISESISIPI